jgi:hypothetical protein
MPRQTRLVFVVFCSAYLPTHLQQLPSRDRLAGPRASFRAKNALATTGSHILGELVAVVVHSAGRLTQRKVMQLHREARSGN